MHRCFVANPDALASTNPFWRLDAYAIDVSCEATGARRIFGSPFRSLAMFFSGREAAGSITFARIGLVAGTIRYGSASPRGELEGKLHVSRQSAPVNLGSVDVRALRARARDNPT